jgi:hypothetical protein
MGLGEIMSREAASGFPGFAGSQVDATLVVAEGTLVDVLQRFARLPRTAAVHIHEGNRIRLRYAGFESGAVLAQSVDLQHKRLLLWLDSVLVGWALGYLVRSPAVQVSGRQVSIDFGRLNGFDRYSAAFAHVRAIRVSTAASVVRLQVDIAVGQELAAH